MPKTAGTLTTSELKQKIAAGEIDTVLALFTDHYGRNMGKRFEAGFFVEEALAHGWHACDYLLTVDMEMNPVPGYRFANWEQGYGDFALVPDLATLRIASWLDRTAIVLCDVQNEKTHAPVSVAPRSILRAQLARAAKHGWTAKAAGELEHYLYRQSYADAAASGFRNLQPAGQYLEDYHALQGTRTEDFHGAARRHLQRSGIPVETSKGEWGLGQHELNIRYAEALESADRQVIFKQCLKELADAHGLAVTFMAKPFAEQAGSSCHIHLSLWKGQANAFAGNKTNAQKKLGPVACSDTFRFFLGGWIAHAAEVMVCYAPTINSYKRYQAGSWAPTKLAWSYDNRTAGFRVVGDGPSLRIECRIPGADCNPYLAFAAALASGLDGIENEIEPPPMFTGDVYAAQDLPHVPKTLREAAERFAKSPFTTRAFGKDVVEHYAHFYANECDQYDKAVTDWERARYFERI